MTNDREESADRSPHQTLRQRAEELLCVKPFEVSTMRAEDVQALVHDLSVRQIELEIQNQELREAQIELAQTRDQYVALYEFAPVGYVTLDKHGRILDGNFTAATLLGVTRPELLKSSLEQFVNRGSLDAFRRHRRQVFSESPSEKGDGDGTATSSSLGTKQTCEIEMCRADGSPLFVRLDCVAFDVDGQRQCRTALIDVTRQNSAEEALRQFNDALEQRVVEQTSEIRLLAKATESFGEGVLITDDDLDWPGAQIVFVNDAMCRITGYSREELIGQSPRILQGEATDRATLKRIKSELSSGRSVLADLTNYCKDGTSYDAELFITPLFDSDGRRTNFVSIYRDITQRKRAERELRRMSKVFLDASEAVFLKDLSGKIIDLNPAAERQYGWSRDELIGRSMTMLVPPDEHQLRDELRARCIRGEAVRAVEVRRLTKSGHILPVLLTSSLLTDEHNQPACIADFSEDITERKLSERELQQREQLLQLFVKHVPAPVAMFDRDMRYLFASRRWREDYGLGDREIIGHCHYDVFPAIPERWRELHRRALAGEVLHDDEDSFVRADGRVEWVKWELLPWHTATGEIGGVILFSEVITDRRQAEESLRISEERFRQVFEHAGVGIAIADSQGRLQQCNPAFCTLLGYREEELRDIDFSSLVHPDERESNQAQVHRLRAEELSFIDTEVRYLHRDGHAIVVRKFASILHDHVGNPAHLVALVTDMTERRLAEQAIYDREQRLRAVLNAAADAIVTIDSRGTIRNLNPATERMFGYAQDELIGENVSILMPPPYCDEHDGYIARYLETGKAGIIGIGREVPGRRKDGSTFPADLVVSEVDHLGLFTGIIRDISERRALQREVLAAADDEQRRIGQDLHDGVQQELAGLGMLAHALLATLAKPPQETESGSPRDPRRLAQKILDGLSRAQQDVKAIARGMVPAHLDRQGLTEALRELAVRTDSTDGVICAFKCRQPVEVSDSPTRTHLYRIAQEAVTNAIRHGRPEHILIELKHAGGEIVLQIADDGTGFDAADRTEGVGLDTMHYRASLIGGQLAVSPVRTGGTLVTCKVGRR
ncbi:MAG: PAS domain S-box protein [Planctomycetaceae bacterium]